MYNTGKRSMKFKWNGNTKLQNEAFVRVPGNRMKIKKKMKQKERSSLNNNSFRVVICVARW